MAGPSRTDAGRECVEMTDGWYERRVGRVLFAHECELLTMGEVILLGSLGVVESLRDFLSDCLRGDSPSGMTGSACAILSCAADCGLSFL
jgi:hypothetical protein